MRTWHEDIWRCFPTVEMQGKILPLEISLLIKIYFLDPLRLQKMWEEYTEYINKHYPMIIPYFSHTHLPGQRSSAWEGPGGAMASAMDFW
jgi:hypothetical protein